MTTTPRIDRLTREALGNADYARLSLPRSIAGVLCAAFATGATAGAMHLVPPDPIEPSAAVRASAAL